MKYKSSVLNCYDNPDHCLVCRFLDGDRRAEVLMAVVKQLDSKLERSETNFTNCANSLAGVISDRNEWEATAKRLAQESGIEIPQI